MADETSATDGPAYRVRVNLFSGPRIYRLTETALTWQDDGKPLDGVFFDDIAEVRVAYAPTRFATNRFITRIVFRQGGMVELTNIDFRGFANFVEENDAYVAFVREFHRRVANAPGVVFQKGSSPGGYALNLVITAFVVVGIAFALFMLLNFGLVWIAVAKLAIIAVFVPVLFRFVRRAKPERYDPAAIPAEALPQL